jgi:type IV secretory pathway component VirB8
MMLKEVAESLSVVTVVVRTVVAVVVLAVMLTVERVVIVLVAIPKQTKW